VGGSEGRECGTDTLEDWQGIDQDQEEKGGEQKEVAERHGGGQTVIPAAAGPGLGRGGGGGEMR